MKISYLKWPKWIRYVIGLLAVAMAWVITILAFKLVWYALKFTWELLP